MTTLDVRFRVLRDGALWCWVPDLGKAPQAKREVRLWAWLRSLNATRIRRRDNSMVFRAQFMTPQNVNPYRTGCLCGWRQAFSTMDMMVHAHLTHCLTCPEATACSFHGGSTVTKRYGEIICVTCQNTVGWDAVTQAGLTRAG